MVLFIFWYEDVFLSIVLVILLLFCASVVSWACFIHGSICLAPIHLNFVKWFYSSSGTRIEDVILHSSNRSRYTSSFFCASVVSWACFIHGSICLAPIHLNFVLNGLFMFWYVRGCHSSKSFRYTSSFLCLLISSVLGLFHSRFNLLS
jgi:hypothetical protein